jgi:hypothetical protein
MRHGNSGYLDVEQIAKITAAAIQRLARDPSDRRSADILVEVARGGPAGDRWGAGTARA